MKALFDTKKVLLSHPVGSPFSKNALLALKEANLLHEVVTTFVFHENGHLDRSLNLLPARWRARLREELCRRSWMNVRGVPSCTRPFNELFRILMIRSGWAYRIGIRDQHLLDWVCRSLDRHVAKRHMTRDSVDAVYAYEDTAAETFQEAKKKGIVCFYDLPILFYRHSRQLQQEEARAFPELAPALQAVHEPEHKLKIKEMEVKFADHIFVPSSMVKQSLVHSGVDGGRIDVLPYGAPIDYFRPGKKRDSIFRVLFVGLIGPRKGAHYLLEAWKGLKLSQAELLLIGKIEFPQGWLEKYGGTFRHHPPRSTCSSR